MVVAALTVMCAGPGANADERPLLQGRTSDERFIAASPSSTNGIAQQWKQVHPSLQTAIDISVALAKKDEAPDTDELKKQARTMGSVDPLRDAEPVTRIPRDSHVTTYTQVRPWAWFYCIRGRLSRLDNVSVMRLSFLSGEVLRELIEAPDPMMKAMAAEALGVLHVPDDVPRIARLLDDNHAAAPYLGYNDVVVSLYVSIEDMGREPQLLLPGGCRGVGVVEDNLDIRRSWRKETVHQCAQRVLYLMTGQRFDSREAFETWWKRNNEGRNCLWYWQQRIGRELREADVSIEWPHLIRRPDESHREFEARQDDYRQTAYDRVRAQTVAELNELSPEVEAKVKLLFRDEYLGRMPIAYQCQQFWPDHPKLRISANRILDLLDRKDEWTDVPWEKEPSSNYDRFAWKVGLSAAELLRPSDAPRLRSILEGERQFLGHRGISGLIIGISRLLPPAIQGALDNQDSRDGFLRNAVTNEHDVFVRVDCVGELVRVGLPSNTAFLTSVAFGNRENDEGNRIMQQILRALAEPPLTSHKRKFLVDLLLDKRFETFWTRPNSRMGMDICRRYGIWAVNKHAGKEVIDDSIKNQLTDPNESAHALEELRKIVSELGKSE